MQIKGLPTSADQEKHKQRGKKNAQVKMDISHDLDIHNDPNRTAFLNDQQSKDQDFDLNEDLDAHKLKYTKIIDHINGFNAIKELN